MNKKIVWIIVSWLMVIALVLSSCRAAPPAEGEKEIIKGKVTEKEGKVEEEKVPVKEEEKEAPAVKEPQYGGTLRVCLMGGGETPPSWDPGIANWITSEWVSPVCEKPLIGDVDKFGPRGTNKFHFCIDETVPLSVVVPHLVESWELTEDSIIYHLRKGIHFQNKPPVNGREMDAEDVALSLNRVLEVPRFKTGYWKWVDSIEATDKYTVEIKFKEFNSLWKFYVGMGYYTDIYARELVEQGLIGDWRYLCGTGPFILTDYVDGVAGTYKKNPDYWGTTTIDGKEYRLPFVDKLVYFIMPDPAAFKAAMTTGKIDCIRFAMPRVDLEDILRGAPEVKYAEFPYTHTYIVHFRCDIPPTNDIRVRKALMYAIDYSQLREVTTGRTEKWCSMVPVGWGPEQYTPWEELPREYQMYFEHHPEEAKKLLAEAGYPNGFKTQLMLPSYPQAQDLASVIAANWEEIGVKTELKVMDRTVLDSTFYRKKHSPALMVIHGGGLPLAEFSKQLAPGGSWNVSCWEDPHGVDLLDRAFRERDEAKCNELVKELNMYWLDQAVAFRCPQRYSYIVWWPWLKNYAGETSAGFHHRGYVDARIWIDQELKKEMGH